QPMVARRELELLERDRVGHAARLRPVARPRTYLRSLDPRLPQAVWMLEIGTLVNFFGSGVAYPFLFIYLHNVRGFALGTGGLVGGLVARASHPGSFTVLFLVDTASYLAMIAFLPLVPSPELPPGTTDAAPRGYLHVLRDRAFVSLSSLNIVYIAAGYATF